MGGGCLGVMVVMSLMADVAAVSTVAAASGSLVCGGCRGSCGGGSGSSGPHQPRDGSCAVTVIIVQAELRLNHVGSRRSRPYFTQKERKKTQLKKD